jgi:hypothetical protein
LLVIADGLGAGLIVFTVAVSPDEPPPPHETNRRGKVKIKDIFLKDILMNFSPLNRSVKTYNLIE